MISLICAMSDPGLRREDVMGMLRKYLPPASEELGLSSVAYDVAIPDFFGDGGMFENGVLYDNGGKTGVKYEKRIETKNGGYLYTSATAPEEDPKQREGFEAVAALMFSMCGKINSVSDLSILSVSDNLTGALNMTGFRQKAIPLVARGMAADCASVFINIKNFKYINQKIGMPNGDHILRKLVQSLKRAFGGNGALVARLGADNFVLLLKQSDLPALTDMLKNFNVDIAGGEGGAEIKVYFRTGVYYLNENSTFEDLMNCCSCAYNAAKNGGSGDFVLYEPYMAADEHRTKKVLVTFPEAIKKREFKVYYQPKVRAEDNVMVGAEALCRWVKDGEVISPGDFIPVLERFGNISQLDLYMVEAVASDLRRCIDAGAAPVRTSLNISRRDLAVPHLADRINEIVNRYAIPHELIEIELTETFTTDEFSLMLKLINELREMGYKISIDDFGSGYSTLTLLKSIRADIIKLDRAFIKDMTDPGSEDGIILRNVVHMVNELDIEVIAEGVETAEQVKFLDDVGCKVIQGYYFDRPLPVDEFDKRLSDAAWYAKRAEGKND